VPKTCEIIYELPADATDIKAKFGDLSLLGSKEALVELGF
jgi:hypothetical protein